MISLERGEKGGERGEEKGGEGRGEKRREEKEDLIVLKNFYFLKISQSNITLNITPTIIIIHDIPD